jgi:hypothetical protein
MRYFAATAVGLLAAPVVAYGTDLPSNVTVRQEGKRSAFIEAVDFSYKPAQLVTFSAIKLCVAENISNNAVSLRDSSNAFVGPASGNYYSNTQSQTVQGGSIFKYVDDASATLIATGTTDGGSSSWGLIRDFVKFELKAAISDMGVTLQFTNIARAQQDTGLSSNNGFQPVATWKGARPMKVYSALEKIAAKIKSCTGA